MSAPTGEWSIEPDQTTVEVVAKNFLVRSVRGTLAVESGSATVTDDLAGSVLEVTLDAESFHTGNAKRDEHVRSDDFVGAATYPDITFRGTSVVATGDDYSISGELTVGASTAPVTVDIKVHELSDDRAEFRGTTWIDRHTIGLGRLPTLVIGRTLAVTVDGVASRR